MEKESQVMDWQHQTDSVAAVHAAREAGCRRILLTIPTGGGKTRVAVRLSENELAEGGKVSLYTNRKLLIEQTAIVFGKAGLEHGIRAAEHGEDHDQDLQISSIQTESSRVLKRKTWKLHGATLVIVDEAHLQKADVAKELFRQHAEAGATIVGLTATPIDLAEMYDELIIGGTVSQLRNCGALVPAHHYGPDEPDLKHVGKITSGVDLTEKENAKAIMTPTIFARVLDSYHELNPGQKPAILFAPGVAESVWFAEQFHANGISAAHIDGEEIWMNGELVKSEQYTREKILRGSKDGSIKVLCNRFVLREGIDCPWLEHGILATVLGSLQSYLQVGGRLLRAAPDKEHATIQDHGGNWHRHGSLNADREWKLEYTAGIVAGLRVERMRAKKEKEPVRCPACARIIMTAKCPCGYVIQPGRKSRPVIQSDGRLKEMTGDIYRPHRVCRDPSMEQVWEKMYHRSRTGKGERTFRAAMALFAYENNWVYPDPAWRFMPTTELDHFRMVGEVPRERLT